MDDHKEVCEWSLEVDDWNAWHTGCEGLFEVTEGTPADNHMRFCCYCGKPIKELPYEP